MRVCVLTQSCQTLGDPMDCSLPDSSVRGILQARILEGVVSPNPGNLPDPGIKPAFPVSSALAKWILYHSASWEALSFL